MPENIPRQPFFPDSLATTPPATFYPSSSHDASHPYFDSTQVLLISTKIIQLLQEYLQPLHLLPISAYSSLSQSPSPAIYYDDALITPHPERFPFQPTTAPTATAKTPPTKQPNIASKASKPIKDVATISTQQSLAPNTNKASDFPHRHQPTKSPDSDVLSEVNPYLSSSSSPFASIFPSVIRPTHSNPSLLLAAQNFFPANITSPSQHGTNDRPTYPSAGTQSVDTPSALRHDIASFASVPGPVVLPTNISSILRESSARIAAYWPPQTPDVPTNAPQKQPLNVIISSSSAFQRVYVPSLLDPSFPLSSSEQSSSSFLTPSTTQSTPVQPSKLSSSLASKLSSRHGNTTINSEHQITPSTQGHQAQPLHNQQQQIDPPCVEITTQHRGSGFVHLFDAFNSLPLYSQQQSSVFHQSDEYSTSITSFDNFHLSQVDPLLPSHLSSSSTTIANATTAIAEYSHHTKEDQPKPQLPTTSRFSFPMAIPDPRSAAIAACPPWIQLFYRSDISCHEFQAVFKSVILASCSLSLRHAYERIIQRFENNLLEHGFVDTDLYFCPNQPPPTSSSQQPDHLSSYHISSSSTATNSSQYTPQKHQQSTFSSNHIVSSSTTSPLERYIGALSVMLALECVVSHYISTSSFQTSQVSIISIPNIMFDFLHLSQFSRHPLHNFIFYPSRLIDHSMELFSSVITAENSFNNNKNASHMFLLQSLILQPTASSSTTHSSFAASSSSSLHPAQPPTPRYLFSLQSLRQILFRLVLPRFQSSQSLAYLFQPCLPIYIPVHNPLIDTWSASPYLFWNKTSHFSRRKLPSRYLSTHTATTQPTDGPIPITLSRKYLRKSRNSSTAASNPPFFPTISPQFIIPDSVLTSKSSSSAATTTSAITSADTSATTTSTAATSKNIPSSSSPSSSSIISSNPSLLKHTIRDISRVIIASNSPSHPTISECLQPTAYPQICLTSCAKIMDRELALEAERYAIRQGSHPVLPLITTAKDVVAAPHPPGTGSNQTQLTSNNQSIPGHNDVKTHQDGRPDTSEKSSPVILFPRKIASQSASRRSNGSLTDLSDKRTSSITLSKPSGTNLRSFSHPSLALQPKNMSFPSLTISQHDPIAALQGKSIVYHDVSPAGTFHSYISRFCDQRMPVIDSVSHQSNNMSMLLQSGHLTQQSTAGLSGAQPQSVSRGGGSTSLQPRLSMQPSESYVHYNTPRTTQFQSQQQAQQSQQQLRRGGGGGAGGGAGGNFPPTSQQSLKYHNFAPTMQHNIPPHSTMKQQQPGVVGNHLATPIKQKQKSAPSSTLALTNPFVKQHISKSTNVLIKTQPEQVYAGIELTPTLLKRFQSMISARNVLDQLHPANTFSILGIDPTSFSQLLSSLWQSSNHPFGSQPCHDGDDNSAAETNISLLRARWSCGALPAVASSFQSSPSMLTTVQSLNRLYTHFSSFAQMMSVPVVSSRIHVFNLLAFASSMLSMSSPSSSTPSPLPTDWFCPEFLRTATAYASLARPSLYPKFPPFVTALRQHIPSLAQAYLETIRFHPLYKLERAVFEHYGDLMLYASHSDFQIPAFYQSYPSHRHYQSPMVQICSEPAVIGNDMLPLSFVPIRAQIAHSSIIEQLCLIERRHDGSRYVPLDLFPPHKNEFSLEPKKRKHLPSIVENDDDDGNNNNNNNNNSLSRRHEHHGVHDRISQEPVSKLTSKVVGEDGLPTPLSLLSSTTADTTASATSLATSASEDINEHVGLSSSNEAKNPPSQEDKRSLSSSSAAEATSPSSPFVVHVDPDELIQTVSPELYDATETWFAFQHASARNKHRQHHRHHRHHDSHDEHHSHHRSHRHHHKSKHKSSRSAITPTTSSHCDSPSTSKLPLSHQSSPNDSSSQSLSSSRPHAISTSDQLPLSLHPTRLPPGLASPFELSAYTSRLTSPFLNPTRLNILPVSFVSNLHSQQLHPAGYNPIEALALKDNIISYVHSHLNTNVRTQKLSLLSHAPQEQQDNAAQDKLHNDSERQTPLQLVFVQIYSSSILQTLFGHDVCFHFNNVMDHIQRQFAIYNAIKAASTLLSRSKLFASNPQCLFSAAWTIVLPSSILTPSSDVSETSHHSKYAITINSSTILPSHLLHSFQMLRYVGLQRGISCDMLHLAIQHSQSIFQTTFPIVHRFQNHRSLISE